MRVFVTGATGFVGSAVVKDLLAAGHEVVGLARSDKGGEQLKVAGATVLRGSLEDIDSLRRGAADADAVVHTAFNHDFSKYAENAAQDRAAILAMGEVLKGSSRPLLATSGTLTVARGRLATEDDPPMPHSDRFPRASEAAIEEVAKMGVKSGIVRLPPSTHGAGDHGFVPALIGIARSTGVAAYVGDGSNRWSATHRLDAAKVYRRALETGVAQPRYHAIAEEGVRLKDVAELIGRKLGLPVVSKTAEEALTHFGFLGAFVAGDVPTSGARTQQALGWTPTQPGLLADMEANYF